jgi:hypothetical protein
MSLERVYFGGDIFSRHTETDEDWERIPRKGLKPIAHGSMEIFGETQPLALTRYLSGENSKLEPPHLYEYTWNVGLNGYELEWIENLQDDDAALVQIMVIPGDSPFISMEIFATLEYLPPTRNIPHSPGLLHWAKTISSGVGKAADNVHIPVVGAVGSLFSAAAELVPPERPETKWFLNKFALPGDCEGGSCYGIEWHFSRGLIHEIGSRLVGHLGLVFIDAPLQGRKQKGVEGGLTLQGRFGLKLARTHDQWFDFSLVPGSHSQALSLRVQPQRAGVGSGTQEPRLSLDTALPFQAAETLLVEDRKDAIPLGNFSPVLPIAGR